MQYQVASLSVSLNISPCFLHCISPLLDLSFKSRSHQNTLLLTNKSEPTLSSLQLLYSIKLGFGSPNPNTNEIRHQQDDPQKTFQFPITSLLRQTYPTTP